MNKSPSTRYRRSLEIEEVRSQGDFKLCLKLSNGQRVERDFSSWVKCLKPAGVLAPLLDKKFFRRARVRNGTLAWPGNLDLCPDVIIWGTSMPSGRGRPRKLAVFPVS